MLLREFFESSENEVAIIFGRFNPPHKGHRAAWELAAKSPAWYVGTNKSTVGPKDPLPYEVKVQAMEAIWPDVAKHLIAETSWLTMASMVYKKHGKINLKCLTDEDWVTKAIMQYNGKEGPHGFYDFPNIEQVPTPRLSSATALRDAVMKGDRKAFSDAAGVSSETKIAGKPFFDLVAEYLLPYADAAAKKGKKVKESHKDKAKIKLYTDPKYFGAEVDDSAGDGKPVVNIQLADLVGFEPDEKMKDAKSAANMSKMVKLIKAGKGDELPPILARRYKGGYQVLDGHHRFHAYQAAGAKTIPAKVIPADEIEVIDKAPVNEAKKRLDRKCWTGYKKQGTKLKNGVRVNNCVPKESADGKIAETRQGAWQWLKDKLPRWPDYVLRDWLYQALKGDAVAGAAPQGHIDQMLDREGLGPDTVWKLVPNFEFTMGILNPWTVDKLHRRWAGKSDAGIGVTNDAARHATQHALIKQQGGISKEPVILVKKPDGYELEEGWHRTIQHFALYPNGYNGPAWVAVSTNINENFADGKGPGRKGDSQRHGIPKKATMAQLEKAAKAPGRKGQLARWQLNMRRGRAKAEESDQEMNADQWQDLRKSDPRAYLGIKDYRNRKWWESHFKAAMARARVKGESHFEFPPGTKMYYMVTKNPLEEGGSPPHGSPEHELAMMKARTKPAVTFLDMGQYEELYEPNMEHYGWIKQKWRLPNMDVNYYVIGQPGQEARVKRIGQLIYDMNKAGGNPTADYHRELGRLLGYSEADINSFLKDLEQDS